MSAIRSSLDRIGLSTNATEPELLVLKRRALIEQGIAVIDLGKVRSRDWAFSKWLQEEAKRQLGIERKEARS